MQGAAYSDNAQICPTDQVLSEWVMPAHSQRALPAAATCAQVCASWKKLSLLSEYYPKKRERIRHRGTVLQDAFPSLPLPVIAATLPDHFRNSGRCQAPLNGTAPAAPLDNVQQ
jgi:hypothetical protein